MESYYVISGIKIKGAEIVSELTKETVFEYQGSADGSCGPYSLFMALKIVGVLYKKDLLPYNKPDRRSSVGKFMNQMHDFPHLMKDGTGLRDIFDLIKNNFSSKLKSTLSELKDKVLIDFVISMLVQDKPTIMGITFKDGGGHWMLAVGYACNEKGKPTKLLFLDPSGEKPTFSPWNSVLDISVKRKSEFSYNWSTAGYNVSLEEALSISHKKN
jgi:hypothetical protein